MTFNEIPKWALEKMERERLEALGRLVSLQDKSPPVLADLFPKEEPAPKKRMGRPKGSKNNAA